MRPISVCDITLPTADNQRDIRLSFREKLELCKLLDRLHVSAIELPLLSERKESVLLVKSVAMAVKNASLVLPFTADAGSIEAAWAALSQAKYPRLELRAPMSPMQMEYFWHKKPDKALALISSLISKAKGYTPDVELVCEDATRAEFPFLLKAIAAAAEAGATHITLCDTAGVMFPEELSAFLKRIFEEFPSFLEEDSPVKLGFACTDSLSMAASLSLTALREGVSELRVLSAGEGAASLRSIGELLHTRGEDLGFASPLRFAELRRITGQIFWMCQGSPSSQGSVVSGERIQEEEIILSRNDNLSAVSKAVEKLGYTLSDEDMKRVYEAFLPLAAKKDRVTAREMDSIVATAALQVPSTYILKSYVINCGNVISASANIVLEKDGVPLQGICLGDGPIDAAFRTVEQIVGRHYEVDDFQIQSITEGREALGETVIRLRSGGKLYSGRGLSTDIVGAGIRAYINALNKIVYEEAEE